MRNKPNCRWCGQANPEGPLCAVCLNKAHGLGRLSRDELDALPYGILRLDSAGVITDISQAEQKMARVTPDRVIGKNFFSEVAPCTDMRSFRDTYAAFIAGDYALRSFDFVYRFPFGPVRVHIALLRISGGAMVITKQL